VLKTNGRPESGWLMAPPRSGATLHSCPLKIILLGLGFLYGPPPKVQISFGCSCGLQILFIFWIRVFSFKTLIPNNILLYKDECEEFPYYLLCGNTSITPAIFLYIVQFFAQLRKIKI
jgi:hypothetical protein